MDEKPLRTPAQGDEVTVTSGPHKGDRARVVCVYPEGLGCDVQLLEGRYKGWNVSVQPYEMERR